MKKALAFLAALTMLAAVGCGDTAKDKPEKEGKQETAASAKAEQKEKDSEDPEKEELSDEDGSDDDGEAVTDGMVNDNNCIIDAGHQDDGNDDYDKADLYKMMELAVEQYNAIIDQDKQAYFDTLNIEGILNDKGVKRLYEQLADMYGGDEVSECELEIYYNAVMALEDLENTEIDDVEHLLDDESITEEEAVDKCDEIIKGAAEDLKPEDVPTLYDIYSPFSYLFGDRASDAVPQSFSSDPSAFMIVPDDSTIFAIELDEYVCNKYGSFAELDLAIAHGDWEYILDEVRVWIDDDQTSVYIGNIRIAENEVKGMTLDEIKEQVSSNKNVNVTNSRAKTAYHTVAEYIYDQEVEGRSMDTVFADEDFLLAADKGLDLENDSVQTTLMGYGDIALHDLYDTGDLPAGKVFVGITEIDGKRTFFVQFLDDTGVIGQYPSPPSSDNWESVVWGEFFNG